jgi:hypothetical protein
MKNMQVKIIVILISFLIITTKINAQDFDTDQFNAITTAAPFLLITPDARAGAMGDIGVATSPDFNSQHHNPAKAAFNNNEFSIGVNFTPWLGALVNDVYLGGFSVINKLDEQSAWVASFKYFTLGKIQLTDEYGENTSIESPNELSFDATYALKLSESFSLGVTGRYIRSDFSIRSQNTGFIPVNSFSVDVSGYYESSESNYGDFNGIFRGGFNISNIGPKVTYIEGGKKNFIPTNLKLGGGFDFILDDYNKVALTLETTKLLVPTPPIRVKDDSGNFVIVAGEDDNVGFFSGMIQSFGDAPGGFKEEMREFTWSIGSEYKYSNAFAFRAGYFHENAKKGARNFFTVGAGFKFKASTIDFSYLFNATEINNPLENTLRFSLGFNIGEAFDYFEQ